MKKVRRRTIWNAYYEDWCPNCRKVVNMENIPHFRGVPCTKCPECESTYQINLMENGNDLIKVLDNYKFPKIKR